MRSRSMVFVLAAAFVLAVAPPPSQVELISFPEVVSQEVAVSVDTDRLVLSSGGAEAPSAFTSDPVVTPIPFTMIGFHLPEGIDEVRVRTGDDQGNWGEWYGLDRVEQDEGPDPDSYEADGDRAQQYTEPVYVGEATRFQVEIPAAELVDVTGAVDVAATVMDTDGLSGGPITRRAVTVQGPTAEANNAPRVVTRSQWGARPYNGRPNYNDNIDLVVVHHTAGNNNYTQAQSAGIVRGIQNWHMNNNRWSDIGYNMLLDRFGTLYEGREGGIARGVIGAHAAGYNTGSFGISVMGNFTSVDAPQAAYEAMTNAIAWKAAIHGFDPLGTTDRVRNGVRVRTITGHRDVGNTTCPGRIGDRLWWIRTEAANRAPLMPATGPGAVPDGRFDDVPSSSHHYNNVVTAHDSNVLLGYRRPNSDLWYYNPGGALNRGDMARAVAVALDLEPVSDWRGRFSDLDDVPWLAPYIVALVDEGVVNGYRDGTFRPRESLRRDQMATYLANSHNLPDARPSFSDVGPGNTHYYRIGAVERAGYTTGLTATTYGPLHTMRRDQSASLLVRAYDIVAPPVDEDEGVEGNEGVEGDEE